MFYGVIGGLAVLGAWFDTAIPVAIAVFLISCRMEMKNV